MPDSKIQSIDDLTSVCEKHRAAGKTVAHCHGAFDLLHPGHIRHLQAAKRMADVLVVTLTEDRFIRKGPGRPIFNEQLRAESVSALEFVDHVATAPWPTAVETIERIKPDMYVKGQDYRDRSKDATGAILLEERTVTRHGGRLVFTDEVQFSSTQLINEHFGVFNDEQRTYLQGFRERFSAEAVLESLHDVRSLRVLVVGEAIIDEYHYCTPDAMSNKSPTLSVRFDSSERFPGGVLAVGNHLAGLCDSVDVVAGCGAMDSTSGEITDQQCDGVRVHPVVRPDAPTVCKRRFVHRFLNQKLFEVTFLNDRPIDDETERSLMKAIETHAPQADVVIVLDFGHGFCTPAVVQHLRRESKFLAVNAQINSSNRGFNSIRKFERADYISIDEYELRLPFGDRYGSLHDLVRRLGEETGCERINVTLGDRGSLYFDGKSFHRAPILTNRMVDAVGAGDALLAITALLVRARAPSAIVPFVGNCMGGLMAQIVGHRAPVDPVDLQKFITTLLK